ncbi:MAG: peptide deformylase [bacterium]|jgi:peptide deformylase|nr:peptide deformylase [candidate division KSB1 bacterium]MDH7559409.1 peptide deformylase [bacterium]
MEESRLLQVRVYGDPVLRTPAAPVEALDEVRAIIPAMVHTMREADGVGLAANQVGLPRRIIVVAYEEQLHILINPEIVSWSARTNVDSEGCLSLPGLQAQVERANKVVVRGLDPEGRQVELVARGLLARIFQHEIDHIDGILFIDRMQNGSLQWIRRREGSDEVDYIDTDLGEVKRSFRQRYHAGKEDLGFERRPEVLLHRPWE